MFDLAFKGHPFCFVCSTAIFDQVPAFSVKVQLQRAPSTIVVNAGKSESSVLTGGSKRKAEKIIRKENGSNRSTRIPVEPRQIQGLIILSEPPSWRAIRTLWAGEDWPLGLGRIGRGKERH